MDFPFLASLVLPACSLSEPGTLRAGNEESESVKALDSRNSGCLLGKVVSERGRKMVSEREKTSFWESIYERKAARRGTPVQHDSFTPS